MKSKRLLGRKYEFEQTLETNISIDYLGDEGTSWGIWEMVRECVQNLMDEAQVQAELKGGHLSEHIWFWKGDKFWRLRDMGKGAELNDIFYLGFSGKRGSGLRGEKGEGQLLAFLVAAREGIECYFISKDYALEPRISQGNGYGHLVMDLYRRGKEIVGTRVLIGRHSMVDFYIEGRRDMFPDLVKPRKTGVERSPSSRQIFIKGPSKLFLKGIYVKDIDALFSYNLRESRISRDRDLVSEEDLIGEIQYIWGDETRVANIERLIREGMQWSTDKLEMRMHSVYLGSEKLKVAWRKAFRNIAGSRRAVSWTNDIIAREARRKGYQVVKVERSVVSFALFDSGIKQDTDVAKQVDPYRIVQPTKREKKLFWILREIALLCKRGPAEFKVFKPTGSSGEYDNRLAFQKGDEIYYRRSHISESTLGELVKTWVHEEAHRSSGAPDESREFESTQAEIWLDIVKFAAGYLNSQMLKWA